MQDHLTTMAAYHAWAFEVLYEALLPLPDDTYRRDCGLFFHSIHGTLNHLLLADRVWFGRCVGEAYAVDSLADELERERERLEQALYAQTARWQPLLASLDAPALAGELVYTNIAGTAFRNPLGVILLHVFNHATHHRGQISAALSGLGHAVPEMDLIWYLRRQEPTAA